MVVPLQVQNAGGHGARARRSRTSLAAAGLDVLVDDRDQRPGVKFKDADLIGVPLRVVVGERGLKDGTIEVKWRNQSEAKQIPAATAAEAILAEIADGAPAARAVCHERRRLARPRGDHELRQTPLPRLPYVLLGAMTLVSFGGPFVILVVVRGGPSARWPPDRPVEWISHRPGLRPGDRALPRLRFDRLVVSAPEKTIHKADEIQERSLIQWHLQPIIDQEYDRMISFHDVTVLVGVALGLVALSFAVSAGLCVLVRRLAPRVGVRRPAGGAQGTQAADAAGRRRGDLADDGRAFWPWACWRCYALGPAELARTAGPPCGGDRSSRPES